MSNIKSTKSTKSTISTSISSSSKNSSNKSDLNNNIDLDKYLLTDSKFRKLNISVNDFNMFNKIKISHDIDIIGIYDNLLYIFKLNDIYLTGFVNMPTRSFYKIKSLDELCLIYTFYNTRINNINSNVNSKNQEKVYDNNMLFLVDPSNNFINTFESLIKYVIHNENCDVVKYYYNIKTQTNLDVITLYDELYNKIISDNEINFYSKYSQSLIKIINCDNTFLINIFFDKLYVRNRYDEINKIDKYISSDVNVCLQLLKLININDVNTICHIYYNKNNIFNIFNRYFIDKLNVLNPYILNKIYEELINDNLHDIHNEKNFMYLKNIINNKNKVDIINKCIEDLEDKGVFRAFENSIDILIKTIYEHYNINLKLDDKNDENHADYKKLDEVINDKVCQLIKNKTNN